MRLNTRDTSAFLARKPGYQRLHTALARVGVVLAKVDLSKSGGLQRHDCLVIWRQGCDEAQRDRLLNQSKAATVVAGSLTDLEASIRKLVNSLREKHAAEREAETANA